MLRAYDYLETTYTRKNIQKTELFGREKSIAQQYVYAHSTNAERSCCPICQDSSIKYLFHRWDVNYYRCQGCGSVFVPVSDEVMKGYLENEAMRELRLSEDYQREADVRRSEIWDDLIHWIKFRTYRYMGRNSGLYVLDYGNRYRGLAERLKESGLCGVYHLKESILEQAAPEDCDGADVILYLNQLQHESDPVATLKKLYGKLKDDGLLLLNTRLGSGFDILTLKGGLDNIFPYEHVMLPSGKGLELILEQAGFQLLEFVTPGTMDVQYVLDNLDRVDEGNLFVHSLFKEGSGATLMDFQRFLQKAGLSSFAQIVAEKKSACRNVGNVLPVCGEQQV